MVGVAGEDDARADRDLLAGQAVGIAAAVPALVLVADDPGHAPEARDRAQDALADDGVLAHDLPLALVELAGLVEDRGRGSRPCRCRAAAPPRSRAPPRASSRPSPRATWRPAGPRTPSARRCSGRARAAPRRVRRSRRRPARRLAQRPLRVDRHRRCARRPRRARAAWPHRPPATSASTLMGRTPLRHAHGHGHALDRAHARRLQLEQDALERLVARPPPVSGSIIRNSSALARHTRSFARVECIKIAPTVLSSSSATRGRGSR